jgi:transcriptional regulator with XRE-family HTH domain
MERDPKYIAEQLKLIRKLRALKQENLADLAGVSTRTIEKAESGRHSPNDQTLRSIARGLDVDVAIFNKPAPEQEAAHRRELDKAIRKSLLVPIYPIRTPQDVLDRYGEWHRWRFDTSALQGDGALAIASTIGDWFQDLDGIWGICSMSDRLSYARSVCELCLEIQGLGYVCYMGQHREKLRERGKPDLIFLSGLVSFQPHSESEAQRYALVHLDGAWETLEEDRRVKMEDLFPKEAKT